VKTASNSGCEQIGVPVFHEENVPPPKLVERHIIWLKKADLVVVVVTAGRSQLDQALMDELQAIPGRCRRMMFCG
jgi:signal recognition particle subunit SRP54